jgi:hypothetical protein
MIYQFKPTIVNPTYVGLVFETKFFERFPILLAAELNGYDIFIAPLIDVQDCGENRSHWMAFGAISLPPLNQRIPYSFRWVGLTSGYGWA